MNQVSALRKFGMVLRVASQVVTQQAARSRTLTAVGKAVQATARSFGHVLHLLWLEVTGAVFLAMAGVGGIALAREWGKYHTGHATPGRVAVAVLFTLTFAWFGVSSFWRVRQKGRGTR